MCLSLYKPDLPLQAVEAVIAAVQIRRVNPAKLILAYQPTLILWPRDRAPLLMTKEVREIFQGSGVALNPQSLWHAPFGDFLELRLGPAVSLKPEVRQRE